MSRMIWVVGAGLALAVSTVGARQTGVFADFFGADAAGRGLYVECTDPDTGAGLAAAVGTVCLDADGPFRKTDTGDTDWSPLPVTTGAYDLRLIIDGGGSTIGTGFAGCTRVPVAGTITASTLLSDDASATAGDIVIDVWVDAFANYAPTDADSITASAPPTLSSANTAEDTTLSGWTTAVTAGDVVCGNVDSAATVTRVSLFLTVTP